LQANKYYIAKVTNSSYENLAMLTSSKGGKFAVLFKDSEL